MSLRRVEHEVSEILIRVSYFACFGLVLEPGNLAIEVPNHCLDWSGWSKRISISERLILIRWNNHGHGQFFQALTTSASIPQAAQLFSSLHYLSFLLYGLTYLSRVPDPEI